MLDSPVPAIPRVMGTHLMFADVGLSRPYPVDPWTDGLIAGLKRRDVIISVDGKAVKDLKEFIAKLKNKKAEDEILVKVKRKSKKDFELVIVLARRIVR